MPNVHVEFDEGEFCQVKKKVSVVAPVKDEEPNIRPMLEEIVEAGLAERFDLELIFVDDGSTDGTARAIQDRMAAHPFVRLFRLDRHYGKSAAWQLGFRQARGDVVVTMDADLQNDPRDIPPMIERLEEGYDLIGGRRRRRADSLWRTVQSRAANGLRRLILRDNSHDTGCGLKAFRRECLAGIQLFQGAHRFVEALVAMHGYRVGHIDVNHRRRRHGKAKFGLRNRWLAPLVDMLGVCWMRRRVIVYRFTQVHAGDPQS